MEAELAGAVAAWPEQKTDVRMTEAPAYQSARAADARSASEDEEARAWSQTYLQDVTQLQMLKQHHVHNWDPNTHEFKPLKGCQRSDRPQECKSSFPRTAWQRADATVLCPCQIAAHGMEASGRKNRLASLHGPYTHEWLNPSHPALLTALRGCNVDVQVPYRLPFDCSHCGQVTKAQARAVIEAAQRRLFRKNTAHGLPRNSRISQRPCCLARAAGWTASKEGRKAPRRAVLQGNSARASRVLQPARES